MSMSDIFIRGGNRIKLKQNLANKKKNESLFRLDVNNFDFSSADINNDSWSTSSADYEQSERVNKAH